MIKKWYLINQFRSCFTRFIPKNYAYAFIVEDARAVFAKNIFYWKNFYNVQKPIFQYGKLLASVTALTSLFYNSKAEDDVETNLAQLMQLAKVALEKGDIDRAEALLQLGLTLSEEHNLYIGLPFIYDILASLAIAEGKFEKAELLLVEIIEKLTKFGYPDNNHNIIDFRLRLARMYSSSGYNSLANIGFQNCLDQQKAKILNGDLSEKTGLLYVHILFWYGVHKVRNESYKEARQMISNAYDYSTKIKGLSPKQEMVILYTLADVNSELGDYEVALTSMLNAIILGKGIGSVDLPICYLKLGNIYEKMDMMDKAKHSYEEARLQGEIYGYGEVVTEAITALSNLNTYLETSLDI